MTKSWFVKQAGLPRPAFDTWTHLGVGDGPASDQVQSLAVAPNGTLWFGLEGAGVSRYVPGD